MSEHEIPEELKALEASLRGLSPAAAAIDDRELYFRAGQAASRRVQWAWQSLAAAALVLSAGLGLMLAVTSGQVHVVYVDRIQTSPAPPEGLPPSSPDAATPAPLGGRLAQGSYLQLRQEWSQAKGTDNWVPPPPESGTPARGLRDNLLN